MSATESGRRPGRPRADEVDARRADELAARLESPLGPVEVLEMLSLLRFSDSFVAAACGRYTPATVSNWRSGRRSPNEEAVDRLDQLRVLVSYLTRGLIEYADEPAAAARTWLKARRSWPGHRLPERPIDLLGAGHFASVYEQAQLFVQRLHGRPDIESEAISERSARRTLNSTGRSLTGAGKRESGTKAAGTAPG
jgi:transcriptional regulator with XRE-family HTH domain